MDEGFPKTETAGVAAPKAEVAVTIPTAGGGSLSKTEVVLAAEEVAGKAEPVAAE